MYTEESPTNIEHCYLAEPIDPENLSAGCDPELDANNQTIVKAEWKEITKNKNDKQVSVVLKKLTTDELSKYNIGLDYGE